MDEIELKPCPFCGGKASFNHVENGENAGGICVECDDPMCRTSSQLMFPEKCDVLPLLAEKWNRRTMRFPRTTEPGPPLHWVKSPDGQAIGYYSKDAADRARAIFAAGDRPKSEPRIIECDNCGGTGTIEENHREVAPLEEAARLVLHNVGCQGSTLCRDRTDYVCPNCAAVRAVRAALEKRNHGS